MRQLLILSLALLMFLLNVGLTSGDHICRGKLITSKLSFGQKNEGCGMQSSQQVCLNDDDNSNHLSKTPCCQDAYSQLKINDNYTKYQKQDKNAIDHNNVISLPKSNLISVYSPVFEYFILEPPPRLIYQNFQALHQVFII